MATILTQDKDFFPHSLKDKFSYLRDVGFDGFEIDGKLLLEQFDAVGEAIAVTKFPVLTACGGYGGWIGDFIESKRRQGLEDIALILERLAIIGGKGIVVPAAWGMFSLRLPPMIPPRSAEDDEKVLMVSLQFLDGIAAGNNVNVFLEPLNRYEDHIVNTLERGSYYVRKGRFSHVFLTADFYHMNIEEASIAKAVQHYNSYIGHIHLADNHRYQPGSGHIDFKRAFDVLRTAGYKGAFAIECRVTGQDHGKEYLESLRHIRKLCEAAGL